ncbi:phage tail fiber protein [Escherichia coli]|uniref:Phage tail fiber protein n=1 Tax=Escherichia coli TaxID=562 RepID=A0A377F6Q7_ECOLX|nr:phage tail fiber protein [Escherichia coli]
MANLPETPQWEDGIYQIEVSDPVLGGPDGISNRQGKQLASRTLYLKQQVEKGGSDLAKHIAAADPHTQYAPKASPTFTGTPTAPTPENSDNSKKLATTEFVAKALAALAGSAPETLDTLKELADALGNDPNFATTVLNKLAEKLAKDQNGADIPDPALFVKNLGLGEGSALPVGVPVPWPSATPPTGWLKCNGAAFSAEEYPELAKAYPTNKLPDLRGEFIRGWDDGRGMDTGRAILSAQGDAIRNIYGEFKTVNTENYSIWNQ